MFIRNLEIFLGPMPLFAGSQTCAQNGIKCVKDAAKVLKPKKNLTPLATLKVKYETVFRTFPDILSLGAVKNVLADFVR